MLKKRCTLIVALMTGVFIATTAFLTPSVVTGQLGGGKKKAFERANADLEGELTKKLVEQLENRL